MSEPELVRRESDGSVTDRVVNTLRASILSGRLRPGQEFSLRQIAAELGVSFIPVREALRSLEAEGLMLNRPGRSATVTPLSAEELDGAFRLRRQIEPYRAVLVAPLHRPVDLDRLERQMDVCADDSTDPDQHAMAHIALHLGLLQTGATTLDARMLSMLVRATSRYVRIGMEAIGTPLEQHRVLGNPHLDLLAAFRTREPAVARLATLRHLDELEEIARKALSISQ